jgi:hypothetical protein
MQEHKLEKNLIFYNPGKSGTLFTYEAGRRVSSEMLDHTIDCLEHDSGDKIEWVEERRRNRRVA